MKDQKQNQYKMDESNIGILEYETWNNDQINTWIMNLENGKFKKYTDILSKSLSEEDVKGIDLKTVDISDLKGWGVVNFADRKALFMSIQDLINPNDNRISMLNKEGAAESGGYFK